MYAHDSTNLRKHNLAQRLLSALSDTGRLVYTAQVLNEFCSRMMRAGRPPGLAPSEVLQIVGDAIALRHTS